MYLLFSISNIDINSSSQQSYASIGLNIDSFGNMKVILNRVKNIKA